jgi:hypothetical protein
VELAGVPQSDLFWGGEFQFRSVIADVQVGENTAPFFFTGSLAGRDASGLQIADLALVGQGIATARTIDGNHSQFGSIEYAFSAVPEPSTLILLASGLVAISLRRKKANKAFP